MAYATGVSQGKHYVAMACNGQSLAVGSNQGVVSSLRSTGLQLDGEIVVWSWMPDLPSAYTTGKWVRLDSLDWRYNSMGMEAARQLAAQGHNVALIDIANGGQGLNAYWRKGQTGYTILTGQINAALSALSGWGNTWEWGPFVRRFKRVCRAA